MVDNIIIRNARPDDYHEFRKMEEIAWQNSDIPVIEEDMFNSWIKTFPEGLLLAMQDDRVVGHVYAQICYFDPWDVGNNKNWHEATDGGYTIRTHNPDGNTLYIVSISAVGSGAGKLMINCLLRLSKNLNKQFVGVCRIPGLRRHARKIGRAELTKEEVMEYVAIVRDTIQRRRKGQSKLFDPVLSIFLSVKNSEYCRVIENFITDSASLNWGCVLRYKWEEIH